MEDNFFKDAHVTHSFKSGDPGTKKIANKSEFSGKLIRVRHYENKITGEKRVTYEIDPERE